MWIFDIDFFLNLLLLSFCLVILSWNSTFNDTFCNWVKNSFFVHFSFYNFCSKCLFLEFCWKNFFFAIFMLFTDGKIIYVSIILKLIIVLHISTRWFFYYLLLNKDFSFFFDINFLLCKISEFVLGIFKFIVF